MPIGSRTPSASSTTNVWGSTWMISRSCGTLMARAASTARSTSAALTSRSRPEIATTPRLLSERMWPPATPAYTRDTSTPAICSASATACLIASTVESMLTTTPRRRPREGAEPTPMTSRPPPGLGSADHRADLGGADVETRRRGSGAPSRVLHWSGCPGAASKRRWPVLGTCGFTYSSSGRPGRGSGGRRRARPGWSTWASTPSSRARRSSHSSAPRRTSTPSTVYRTGPSGRLMSISEISDASVLPVRSRARMSAIAAAPAGRGWCAW